MARRFLDDVKSDLSALLVTGGNTPAPALADLLIDTIDSTVDDESAIFSSGASLGVAISTAWTPITAAYDGQVGGDADFLKTDFAAGTITTTTTAGFTYKTDGFVSFTDLGANVVIEFAILRGGVPVGVIATLTGGGNNRPRIANFSSFDLSNSPDDVYSIGIRTPDGAQSIDILDIALAVTISPTRNP